MMEIAHQINYMKIHDPDNSSQSKESNRLISTFIGAIKTNDLEIVKEFFEDMEFISEHLHQVSLDIIKNKDFYKLTMDSGLEDLLFSGIDSSKINEITLEVMRRGNFYALDFIINNGNELNFNINASIKNRGYMEIALFFNSPESVELLLINEIKITNNISTACESWVSDNFMFLENPMHSHFKNKYWRSDFIQILSILKQSGWDSISRLATDLLNNNASKVMRSVRVALSSREIDSERVIKLINKLDKDLILEIKNSLDA